MWISFAWTSDQFKSGQKTVTRRWWQMQTLLMWQAAWDRGEKIHDAYDKLPRNRGKIIGHFKLTERPHLQRLCDMPESDLEAEGGLWNSKEVFVRSMIANSPSQPIKLVNDKYVQKRATPESSVAVIRFEKFIPDDQPQQQQIHFTM